MTETELRDRFGPVYAGEIVPHEYWVNVGSIVLGSLLWLMRAKRTCIERRRIQDFYCVRFVPAQLPRTTSLRVLQTSCTTDDGCGARCYSFLASEQGA